MRRREEVSFWKYQKIKNASLCLIGSHFKDKEPLFFSPSHDVHRHSEADAERGKRSGGLIIDGPHADNEHQEECHNYFRPKGACHLVISGDNVECGALTPVINLRQRQGL